jgi:hypothetical protein
MFIGQPNLGRKWSKTHWHSCEENYLEKKKNNLKINQQRK